MKLSTMLFTLAVLPLGMYAQTGKLLRHTAPIKNSTLAKTFRGIPISSRAIAFPDEKPITEEPAGLTDDNLARSSFGIVPGSGLEYVEQLNSVGSYTVGEDGNLYIHNPFTNCYTFSWAKLTHKEGNTYVLHTPQAIETGYDGSTNYLLRLTLQETEEGLAYLPQYTADSTLVGDIEFTFTDGVLAQAPTPADPQTGLPTMLFGLVDNKGEWQNYATTDLVLRPFNQTPTELPEGLETKDYVFSWWDTPQKQKTLKLHAAFTDTAVYFENPLTVNPSDEYTPQWIMGEIKDGKVVIPTQFVGLDTDFERDRLFTFGASATHSEEDSTSFDYYKADQIVFDYDAATQSFGADTTQAFYLAQDKAARKFYEVYTGAKLTPYVLEVVNPKAPSILEVQEYDSDTEDGSIHFEMPAIGENAEYVDPDSLFYAIYIDDETQPYTFSAEEYNLDEDMTLVPYNFTDEEYFFLENDERLVYLLHPFNKIGVQAVYQVKGKEMRSNIVWYTSTDIKAATADTKSKEYFDLTGRRTLHPGAGLYIERTKLSNGETITKKVIR